MKERKVVTVLFADLVGFTARAESLDPEDVEAFLRPVHQRLRAELERYGGTVEKFIGDAVMALFGAPVAHEDDPERAVRAALAIRDWAQEEGLELRIGITTGEALVALDARPEAGEGMASGDVVNAAARLEQAAPPNAIVVDASTRRATDRAITFRELEPVEARGKAEPIAVWEALEARSRLGDDVGPRSTTPLVGRQNELATLVGALERTRNERAVQLVTIVGVPGIGKSRLVAELLQVVDRDPELITWRQGRSLPYGEGVSFWALAEMVKAHAGILQTDDAEGATRKLREAVAAVDPADADWVTAQLEPLVGIATSELRGDRRAESFAAWRRFLEAIAERGPAVFVFEDLHWADDGLLDFVDHLVDWASGVPLLCVCTARPELLARRPGWGGGKSNTSTLSLSPLSSDETATLLHALLAKTVMPAELQAELVERVGGNPLYAEEFTRMLGEQGAGEPAVPESIQGVIAARLDSLRAGEKTLLQDASVVGKVFWPAALAAVGGRESAELEQELHELERRQFVRRERRGAVAGELQYAFSHLLVRDIAYGQLPRRQRAEKHRRAAEWIEALGPDRSEDRAEMLAHHYLATLELSRAAGLETSELTEPALRALREAGDRAAALSALPAAHRYYTAALELAPAGDASVPYLHLSRAQTSSFYDDKTIDELAAAAVFLFEAGDREAAAFAEATLANRAWVRGERDRADRHMARAAELVVNLAPSARKAAVLSERARLLSVGSGHGDEAIHFAREGLAIAETLGLEEPRAACLNTIGTARLRLGDLGGLEDLEEAIRAATASNVPGTIHRSLNNLSEAQRRLGHWPESSELLHRAYESNRRFGHRSGAIWALGELCLNRYVAGEWDLALSQADEVVASAAGGTPHYLEPQARVVRAAVATARGDLDQALVESAVAESTARRQVDPQALFPALAERSRVLIEAGRLDDAARVADDLVGMPVYFQGYVPLAWTLVDLNRGTDLLPSLTETGAEAWQAVAEAIVSGAYADAADRLAAMGDLAGEAYTRLRAASALVDHGRRSEADAELRHALAFYRSVRADRYVRQGEALLAASA